MAKKSGIGPGGERLLSGEDIAELAANGIRYPWSPSDSLRLLRELKEAKAEIEELKNNPVRHPEKSPALCLLVIRASSIYRSVQFYEQILGFVFDKEKHAGGPEHFVARLGDVIFEIYPLSANDKPTTSTRLGFYFPHYTLLPPRLFDMLEMAGGRVLHRQPIISSAGTYSLVADPDGHKVELYFER